MKIKEDIKKAIKILNSGGIIIYPTDTAFGIGCRIDSENAVRRLFEIRRRPEKMAMPILVDSINMAMEYYKKGVSSEIINMMKDYWPGALTIVYFCKSDKIPPLVRGFGDTIGIRMPDHDIPLSIINETHVPLLGSSANFHDNRTPFNTGDLDKELIKLVDFVIEGESKQKKASTVVECTTIPWKILRQGSILINYEK
jgi:L-threonylcarbamoyladenylate synthase